MVSDALRRLMMERAARAGDETAAAAWEREQRMFTAVKDAFYEGVMAGVDLSWHADRRGPDDYWLESDARMNLFQGPPTPPDPSRRAAMMLAEGRRKFGYDESRDPERVIKRDWLGTGKAKGRRPGKRK